MTHPYAVRAVPALPVRGERHPLGPGVHRTMAPDGGDLLTYCDPRGIIRGYSIVDPGAGDADTCAYITAWLAERYPAVPVRRLK